MIESNTKRLYYNANYDTLTGLLNRFSISEILDEMLRNSKDPTNTITIFFLDLDRFKYINDIIGHIAGDQFIRSVAIRLKNGLSECTALARIGGDEFVLLVEGLKTEADYYVFVQQIRDLFEIPFCARERNMVITASIGSSQCPTDGNDAESLLKNAEIAMYQAKNSGEGQYVQYKSAFQEELQNKIEMENHLRDAIQDRCKQFEAYLQPKVLLENGEANSCEALVRWVTPERIISPAEFIPLAEESGLIVPLSWWMFRECCRIGRHFQDLGIYHKISINVSNQVLLHSDFFPMLENAVEEFGIDITRLDIEITESTLLEDLEEVNIVLNELHNLGVEISVDDFGTGYSSLSYLNALCVDRIKIDRSFIRNIRENKKDEAIVNAIVAMARSLRMVVTAEGVEDREQYNYLKELGCEEGQGYYMSKPVPLNEYLKFLKRWSYRMK